MAEREKSALYPNATWEDCFDFAKTIASFNLKAVSYVEVAKKYSLSSVTTKSFTGKISSSKQFGLISTSNGSTIQLTETAKRLIYPVGETMPIQLECFSLPPLYGKLITVFDGKALPETTTLGNILMNEHKIARAVKDAAAKCFIQSANQLGVIKGGVLCYSDALHSKQRTPNVTIDETFNDSELANERSENLSQVTPAPISIPISRVTDETDYITQSVPVASGKVAKFIIPIDSSEDDLLLLRDMFEVLLKRKFKLTLD